MVVEAIQVKPIEESIVVDQKGKKSMKKADKGKQVDITTDDKSDAVENDRLDA